MTFDRDTLVQGWPSYEGLENSKTLPLWTPANITTRLWLDASDTSTIIETSGRVSQWNDKSGNGFNVTQGTAGNRPVFTPNTLNGKGVVTFDGNDRLINASLTTTQPFFALVVAAVIADPNGAVFFDSYNNVASVFYRGAGTDSPNRIALNTSGPEKIDAIQPATYPVILGALCNGSSSQIFYNGTSQVTGNTGTNGLSGISVGEVRGNPTPIANAGLSGYIQKLVLVNSPTTDIRQRLEGWAAWDVGLQGDLPSDHPYKASPPTL